MIFFYGVRSSCTYIGTSGALYPSPREVHNPLHLRCLEYDSYPMRIQWLYCKVLYLSPALNPRSHGRAWLYKAPSRPMLGSRNGPSFSTVVRHGGHMLGKTWTLAPNHPRGHTLGVTVARGGADRLALGHVWGVRRAGKAIREIWGTVVGTTSAGGPLST